jgi:nucleoid-associated protein YgaU
VAAGPDQPTPPEREVARYWRRLVEANRDRLVDPGNPDLLRPGQTLTLPGRSSP